MKKAVSFEEKNKFIYMSSANDSEDLIKELRKDGEFSVFCGHKEEGKFTDVETRIIEIIRSIKFPVLAIYEPSYTDGIYRNEYSRYYSEKYFNISKNTKRLIFVHGEYEEADFIGNKTEKLKEIESNLIGMIVIKPTKSLGRILLNPAFMEIQPCYLRTAKFEISVGGRICSFDAFPMSGQDKEVMTCAEVNVWQIMEYFGQRYKDYRTMHPGMLLDLIKNRAEVRTLPSRGLTVEQESALFLEAGLSSEIYHRYADELENVNEDGKSFYYRKAVGYNGLSFFEILHFYIESGIPVLMNFENIKGLHEDGHSATCIGHEHIDKAEILRKMREMPEEDKIVFKVNSLDSERPEKYNNLIVLKSWSAYKRYVVMEDHSVPYCLKDLADGMKFSSLSKAFKWRIVSLVVPLHRHVFMKAEDAYKCSLKYIEELFNEGIICPAPDDGDAEIVMRLYLASSRSLKDFRIQNIEETDPNGLSEWLFYNNIEYPKFLWVCEYSTVPLYLENKVNGEIVFDATSSEINPIISMRHSGKAYYRAPDENPVTVFKPRSLHLPENFAAYESRNLKGYNIP